MNKNSIIKKVAVAITIPLLLQVILFILMILITGIIPTMKENIISSFRERGNDRHRYIQDQMLKSWSSINRKTKNINMNILSELEEKGLSTSELNSNVNISNEILTDISFDILDLARRSYTTDTFIVFDTKEEGQENSTFAKKEGIYIKDTDPTVKSENNSDLYLERGPISLANSLGINMNSQWESKYMLNKDEPNNDFFYKPINEAREFENIEGEDLGHWGEPSIITNENNKVLTYSIPLINLEGDPYGVLGIGIDYNYINNIFEDDENNQPNTYSIVSENSGSYESATNIDEEILNKYKNREVKVKEISKNIYKLTNEIEEDEEVYIFKKELELYREHNRASDKKWYVVCFIGGDELFFQMYRIEDYLQFIIVISTLVSIVIAYIMTRNITKPIRALAEKVRQSNPREPLKLEKINISEIDDLSSAITSLSENVAYEASKLNKIINTLNMPIGAFKQKKNEKKVYCTSKFFHILGIEGVHEKAEYIDLESFKLILAEAIKNKYEKEEDVYIIKKENQEDRWIKVTIQEEEIGTFGVIIDVTKNILEKMKIEYERDHDSLTQLLNRRAFRRIVTNKLKSKDIGIAAAIMWDLDNLKFVNDTYGHEYGVY